MKTFHCNKCGFTFSIAANWENMSADEFAEISGCPCGAQMKEVETDGIRMNPLIIDEIHPENAYQMQEGKK